jgi:hypothetical protein
MKPSLWELNGVYYETLILETMETMPYFYEMTNKEVLDFAGMLMGV